METILYMFAFTRSENTCHVNNASAKGRQGTKNHLEPVSPGKRIEVLNPNCMKSQATAFLLGFALTSFVLFLIPGMGKRSSQVKQPNRAAQYAQSNDTTVVNGHFNTNTAIVTP